MNPHFVEILKAFRDEQVEHLVVGAHALAAHGHVRATLDIDLWVRPTEDNADRTWRALQRFRAPLSKMNSAEKSSRDRPPSTPSARRPRREGSYYVSFTGRGLVHFSADKPSPCRNAFSENMDLTPWNHAGPIEAPHDSEGTAGCWAIPLVMAHWTAFHPLSHG
jgi:hypothetical protein